MRRLIGPRRVSLPWAAVVFTAFVTFWRPGVGAEWTTALCASAATVAVMVLMASWGLGGCRFAKNMTALAAAGDESQTETPR